MNEKVDILISSGLRVSFDETGLNVNVLKGVNLTVRRSESVSITGSSGSGKSTLLQVLGGLLKPSKGQVFIRGVDVGDLSPKELGLIRNKHIGFVYQFHHLINEFTAVENVALPLLIGGKSVNESETRALEMLESVRMSHRSNHKPSELSGGERQRVAVARAVVTKPDCIIADEPTGNLDNNTANIIQQLLIDIAVKNQSALIVATHDHVFSKKMTTQYVMKDGILKPLLLK